MKVSLVRWPMETAQNRRLRGKYITVMPLTVLRDTCNHAVQEAGLSNKMDWRGLMVQGEELAPP